jgi:hypothetical protein
MTDILDRLAARHGTVRNRKPSCPRCKANPTAARLMVQVKRTRPKDEGKKADETVVSATRTMCADCVVEVFEEFVASLPEREPADGGRP